LSEPAGWGILASRHSGHLRPQKSPSSTSTKKPWMLQRKLVPIIQSRQINLPTTQTSPNKSWTSQAVQRTLSSTLSVNKERSEERRVGKEDESRGRREY